MDSKALQHFHWQLAVRWLRLHESASMLPARQRIAIDNEQQCLAVRLEHERRSGCSIIFTTGVFDILHAGHVQFLRQAKALGDVLIVGVNSDSSIRCRKGQG